jgi:hypothetical protein
MKQLEWRTVIQTNIFMLKITGMWPKSDTFGLDLYTLYSIICVNFFVALHILFQIIRIVLVFTNLEAVTETMFMCSAESMALFKMYTFIKNIKVVKELMRSLTRRRSGPRTPPRESWSSRISSSGKWSTTLLFLLWDSRLSCGKSSLF